MVLKNKTYSLLFVLLILFSNSVVSQENDLISDAKHYEKQAEDMVRFLEFSLNSLGSTEMSVKQKEVIINESYKKFFRDAEVQIEDDLVEGRDISIYKNVQAYLKDIDFFFDSVHFQFRIREISELADDNGNFFFKIQTDRYLKGITAENDSIENVIERFIEINIDTESKDLKIVSIYTTPLNQDAYLLEWWNNLQPEWQTFLRKQTELSDSVTVDEITKLLAIKKISINEKDSIYNLNPIAQFSDLQDISIHNKYVISLMPLRNLTQLVNLDCSGTSINNLSPLMYSNKLQSLNCSNTDINDLEAISYMDNLKQLNISSTQITDEDLIFIERGSKLNELICSKTSIYKLHSIDSLGNLQNLDCSFTRVFDLTPLSGLKSLQRLNLTNSEIVMLNPLAELHNLQFLKIDSTRIRTLAPLENLNSIRKITCDKSFITETEAKRFMQIKPGCLVIYESQQLGEWWKNLSPEWKGQFNRYVLTDSIPTKEQLHEISNITEIDISNTIINDLQPLQQLTKLKFLKASNTGINSISILSGLFDLEELDVSNTQVASLMPLIGNLKLKKLKLDSTQINDLTPIGNLQMLSYLSIENTKVRKLIS